jgi:2-oxoglutarate dehydrogenase complex dehydrogenase (E1) component-like enzyme
MENKGADLAPDLAQLVRNYPEFDLAAFRMEDIPLDKQFLITYMDVHMGGDTMWEYGVHSVTAANDPRQKDEPTGQGYWTLKELLERLYQCYTSTAAFEMSHILQLEQRLWIQRRVEYQQRHKRTINSTEQRQILKWLVEAESFETFLGRNFPASKRFGVEGCESLLPALQTVIRHAARCGVTHVELGMPHRGRLNVLCNVLQKDFASICTDFVTSSPNTQLGQGDVKYHLGSHANLKFDIEPGNTKRLSNFFAGGSLNEPPMLEPESETHAAPGYHEMHVSLAPNPSHLEAVNAIVMGKTKAKQQYLQDEEQSKVSRLYYQQYLQDEEQSKVSRLYAIPCTLYAALSSLCTLCTLHYAL